MADEIRQDEIQATLQRMVSLLVQRRFEEIERVTNGKRLSADAIKNAIAAYGRELVEPPRGAFDGCNVVVVTVSELPCVDVTMRLWIREEGECDLSIDLTLTRIGKWLEVAIDDLHVK